ncbi:Hypothetical protein R9X50_00181100 [Acrodontium crateriforme]|uniref:Zinc finger C2H2 LYAR-type domain-containing protein n=1 Tax=Acrodontium crateriforme TaxID=150365 RepID=A0AAQ3R8H6_9PEZI|nr:Hypothetical protein R9X50_00181100 [Acrodontium crateriforme]
MVSFSCENCGDVLTKKKLDPHRNQCRGATFTCLDCMVHFYGTDYRAHTSCISEAQKYQGHLYREKDNKKGKNDKRKSQDNSQAMIARSAYVEDVPEGDDMNAVAIVDVPPRAPTPPPAPAALPENVNVFDFLVTEGTPHKNGANDKRRIQSHAHHANGDSQYSQHSNGDRSSYLAQGYSYGNAPVQPGLDRYDSWQNLTDSQQSSSLMPPPHVTPSSAKTDRKKDRSDKKRKRQQVEELDLSNSKRPSSRDAMIVDPPSSATRVLHSGLTGGLSRLVTDPEFYDDRIDAGPTPISPTKRTKRSVSERDASKDDRRRSSYTSYSVVSKSSRGGADDKRRSRRSHRHDTSDESGDDRHRSSTRAIEYPTERPGSVQPSAHNQLVAYSSRAELFLSFINKGPDSERGYSMNKTLKRYHRERDIYGSEREDEDKELWKSLRLRRNDRGEIVLFM